MGRVDPHLVELSRALDPVELGHRIRVARVAAGMTQVAVAGGEVTAAYLSRIEDGQRRPEPGLLKRMAERMGTTLEDLLITMAPERDAEIELAVDQAELRLAQGDPEACLAAVDAVMSDLGSARSAVMRRRALTLRAAALESLGQVDDAIGVLEGLVVDWATDPVSVRARLALARCYCDVGSYSRAVGLGEASLSILEERGLGGLDESVELALVVSAAYRGAGDLEAALRVCRSTIAEAEGHGSAAAQASAYADASMRGADVDGATAEVIWWAKKALALVGVECRSGNMARLRAEAAELHLASDPPDVQAALAIVEGADAERIGPDGAARDVARLGVVAARAWLIAGDRDRARAAADRVAVLSSELDLECRVSLAMIEARLALAEGKRDAALGRLRVAERLLLQLGLEAVLARSWYELAGLLTEVDATDAALAAYGTAARLSGFRVS